MKPAEAYILNQNEPFKSILMHLQVLIEHHFPEVELQFKWKIPFYVWNETPFCYLNPSKKKGYVDVGFYGNYNEEKYQDLIITEGRKLVKSLRYSSVEEIDAEVLITILTESNKNKKKGYWKK